jgi:hypothetical protein
MPRIYTSASDPIDFCRRHFPSEDAAYAQFGLAKCGEGPDGRGDCFGYDTGAPSYDDDDAYVCHVCGKKLTDARDA